MLVNINLLPQKPKRSFRFLLIVLLMLAMVMALLTTGYVSYVNKNNQLASIHNEIDITVKLREIAEQNTQMPTSTNGFTDLTNSVDWIESQQISTVFILNELVSFLPERGFFMSYQQSDQGSVDITVQFDTRDEAAAYLHRLIASPYILHASLQQLRTEEVFVYEDEEVKQPLPRYMASYSLQVDRLAVKKNEKGSES